MDRLLKQPMKSSEATWPTLDTISCTSSMPPKNKGLLLKFNVPLSPISLAKHFSSPALQCLQNSPDSAQSETLSEATLLFLVAVTLCHRPLARYLSTVILVIAVLAPPNENTALPL